MVFKSLTRAVSAKPFRFRLLRFRLRRRLFRRRLFRFKLFRQRAVSAQATSVRLFRHRDRAAHGAAVRKTQRRRCVASRATVVRDAMRHIRIVSRNESRGDSRVLWQKSPGWSHEKVRTPADAIRALDGDVCCWRRDAGCAMPWPDDALLRGALRWFRESPRRHGGAARK